MPREVLESAERTLAQLEGGSTPRVYAQAIPVERETQEEPGFQLSLFQLDDPTLGALRDKLKAADLDNMTPMQAFDLLRSMKAELGL